MPGLDGGEEGLDRVLDFLHLDRLGEDDQAFVGRQASPAPAAGAEQDEGGKAVAVLVGLLVHVEEGVERAGAEAVGVEDDGVGGRLAERSAARSASPTRRTR